MRSKSSSSSCTEALSQLTRSCNDEKAGRRTDVVLLDVALDLGGVDPGDKVLHVARDEERRVGDRIGTDADVTLLDVGDGLRYGAGARSVSRARCSHGGGGAPS